MSLNYLVEDAFKSTDEIINRIFNHKPFIEAEIRSMVKCFEEDQPNRNGDIDQILDATFERAKDIKDNQIGAINDFCVNKLPPLEGKVERIEELMRKVLNTEQSKESERKVKMNDFTVKQNEEMGQFMQQMDQKMAEIDRTYEQAREQVYVKYGQKQNNTENKS